MAAANLVLTSCYVLELEGPLFFMWVYTYPISLCVGGCEGGCMGVCPMHTRSHFHFVLCPGQK